MNRRQLDTLWHKAMHDAIQSGEDFTRYHFAALVAAAEREACAGIAELVAVEIDDTNGTASYIAKAIRACDVFDDVRTG